MSSADRLGNLTFDGSNTLYSNHEQVPADELRILLSRGSGHIVKGGRRSKPWFQAQCAHYGLRTKATCSLAELRRRLDEFLSHPPAQAPQQHVIEKVIRVESGSGTINIDLEIDIPVPQGQNQTPIRVELPTKLSGSDTQARNRTPEQRASPSRVLRFASPPIGKTSPESTPIATSTPVRRITPRARPTTEPHLDKSSRMAPVDVRDRALKQIESMTEPTHATETESDGGFDSDHSTRRSTSRRTPTRKSVRIRGQRFPSSTSVTQDVVSGQWELQVKDSEHNIFSESMPAPWRPTSLESLQGGINIHFSSDKYSLEAEFTLLGMDGMFRSQRCEQRSNGVYADVQFVAQMSITAAEPGHEAGSDHNLIFGPSKTPDGHLMFDKNGTVRGMLRCRKFGAIEFTGVRVGRPLDFVSIWTSFVDHE